MDNLAEQPKIDVYELGFIYKKKKKTLSMLVQLEDVRGFYMCVLFCTFEMV